MVHLSSLLLAHFPLPVLQREQLLNYGLELETRVSVSDSALQKSSVSVGSDSDLGHGLPGILALRLLAAT